MSIFYLSESSINDYRKNNFLNESIIKDKLNEYWKKQKEEEKKHHDEYMKKYKEKHQDESNNKKYGLITEEEFNKAISLIKPIINKCKKFISKYVEYSTIDDYKKYLKSKSDRIFLCNFYLEDLYESLGYDDIDDFIDSKDYKEFDKEYKSLGEKIDNISEINDIEFLFFYTDYGFFIAIDSKKEI